MTTTNRSPLEMFYHWEENAPPDIFLRQPKDQEWHEYSWSQFADRVRRLTSFIHSLELPDKSHIAILSSNSADWVTVDLAIMLSGHISVPLYPAQDAGSARYILEHSDAKLVFVGAFDTPQKADEMLGTDIPRVAILGCAIEHQYDLESIIESHKPYAQSPIPDHNSTFTVLYTSGTTGNPKGVMHAHGTPGSVVPRQTERLRTIGPDDRERLFSFLPMSHAAERLAIEMRAIYNNSVISFSEGQETFADELRQVRPHLFFAVPRLWIKFKEAIDAKFPPHVQAHFGEEQKAAVRQALGLNETVLAITGSAPTPPEIQAWYFNMGIPLCEGYGMTENFVDGCFNTDSTEVLNGSVGRPISGVAVKISEDGEVCFKSDGLMQGYYKNPEKTAEVIQDGWYHTGDSGHLNENGSLTISGRISEIFKTLKGKFVNPNKLEEKLISIKELGQICVFGHGKDQPMLLANLSPLVASEKKESIAESIKQQLAKLNESLPPYERIDSVFITPQEWTMDNGLLTPTMKLKRKYLETYFLSDFEHGDNHDFVWLD